MRLLAAFVIFANIPALGCDDGDGVQPTPDVNDTAAPIDYCDDAPLLTWDNFGQGFLVENCQPCHARASQARHDAPEEVSFDTRADVVLHRDRIFARATGPEPDMPPVGGISLEDRALLEAWLSCDFDE